MQSQDLFDLTSQSDSSQHQTRQEDDGSASLMSSVIVENATQCAISFLRGELTQPLTTGSVASHPFNVDSPCGTDDADEDETLTFTRYTEDPGTLGVDGGDLDPGLWSSYPDEFWVCV